MKNRWYLWTFIMIAGFVVILLGSSMLGNTGMTTLGAEYPEILTGDSFQGEISWDGGQEPIPLLLTDDQFQAALVSVKLREKEAFPRLPSPCITVRFSDSGEDFSLVVGKDGSLCAERSGDPARRFFLDRTGNIFRGLYEEHLLSGGGEIPEK